MEFRKLCLASLFAALCSGIIGVFLAARGRGLWALAMQQFFLQLFLNDHADNSGKMEAKAPVFR